jgi:hypothetical protein
VVEKPIVADAIAVARLRQEIGRVRHRLHAAGDDDAGGASEDQRG